MRVRITGEPVLNYEELIAIGTQTWHVAVVVVRALHGGASASRCARRASCSRWSASLLVEPRLEQRLRGRGRRPSEPDLGGLQRAHHRPRRRVRHPLLHALRRARRRRALAHARRSSRPAETIGSSLFSSACTTSIGFYIFLLTDFTGVGAARAHLGHRHVPEPREHASPCCRRCSPSGRARRGRATDARPRVAWRALEHLPLRCARPDPRGVGRGRRSAPLALLPRVRFDYNLLRLRDPATESVATFEDLLDARRQLAVDDRRHRPRASTRRTRSRSASRRCPSSPARVRCSTTCPRTRTRSASILETASYFVPAVFSEPPTRSDAERAGGARAPRGRAGHAGGDDGRGSPRARGRLARALRALPRRPRRRGRAARSARRPPGDRRRLAPGAGPRPERRCSRPGTSRSTDLPPDLTEQMLAPDGRARVQVFAARRPLRQRCARALRRRRAHARARGHRAAPSGWSSGDASPGTRWCGRSWSASCACSSSSSFSGGASGIRSSPSSRSRSPRFSPARRLVLVGQPFNFANVIVLPMLIGMGVDNGVHLVHRHRTNPDEVDVLATSTARAVFYAALTTMLSFGSLAFASHRGIAGDRQLLTIGVVRDARLLRGRAAGGARVGRSPTAPRRTHRQRGRGRATAARERRATALTRPAARGAVLVSRRG